MPKCNRDDDDHDNEGDDEDDRSGDDDGDDNNDDHDGDVRRLKSQQDYLMYKNTGPIEFQYVVETTLSRDQKYENYYDDDDDGDDKDDDD